MKYIKITAECRIPLEQFTVGEGELVAGLNENGGEHAFDQLIESSAEQHEKQGFVCKAEVVDV